MLQSKFLWENDLAKSLFYHETNFESCSLKSLNIRGVFRTQSNISGGASFKQSRKSFIVDVRPVSGITFTEE